MLSAVIITLREVLEATFLISALLAISKRVTRDRKWIKSAIGAGLLGAGIFAFNFDKVSDWFDGIGQEVTNVCLLLGVVLSLTGICIQLSRPIQQARFLKNPIVSLQAFFIGAVSIAIMREGAELFVYWYGFSQSLSTIFPVFIGSAIGVAIGLSVAVLFYLFLINIPKNNFILISTLALILIAAGMSTEVAMNLTQADLIPSQNPFWDTSQWVPEGSIMGQLLYATLGYEATPSAVQAVFYWMTVGGMALSVVLAKKGGSG